MPAFDPERLRAREFETVVQDHSIQDAILYALGIGLGADPTDPAQLRYLFEEDAEFAALPTMCTTLATPGFWLRDPELGIDWRKVLHGEQGIVWHASVPVAGRLKSALVIDGVEDKGREKGAAIYTSRELVDCATNERIATITSTILARGNGGCGGSIVSKGKTTKIPDHAPDFVVDAPTLPQSALIYRLSGDYNPLHASPDIARVSGFDRPILHGLCTFGIAGHAILKTCCSNDPARLQAMHLRFSAPVYPGETIRTEIWRDGNTLSFRSRVVERDKIVLNNGYAALVD